MLPRHRIYLISQASLATIDSHAFQRCRPYPFDVFTYERIHRYILYIFTSIWEQRLISCDAWTIFQRVFSRCIVLHTGALELTRTSILCPISKIRAMSRQHRPLLLSLPSFYVFSHCFWSWWNVSRVCQLHVTILNKYFDNCVLADINNIILLISGNWKIWSPVARSFTSSFQAHPENGIPMVFGKSWPGPADELDAR